MALPFDILTQVAFCAEKNEVLALRATCADARDYLTPHAFRALRISCTVNSFARLDDFSTRGSLELRTLVQDLEISQSKENRLELLSQNRSKVDYISTVMFRMYCMLPSLRSLAVEFADLGDGPVQDIDVRDIYLQHWLCYGSGTNASPLQKLELMNVGIHGPHFTSGWKSLSSFSFMKGRQASPDDSDLRPFVASRLITTIDTILCRLPAHSLTTLRLGSAQSPIRMVVPSKVHFTQLISLVLEGFQLDVVCSAWESSDSNLLEFVTKHRSCLHYLSLIDCVLVRTHLDLDLEEGVRTWIRDAEITARIQCSWSD